MKTAINVIETDYPELEQVSEHYIDSQTSLIERPLRTLKYAEAFAVLDSYGDMGVIPGSPEGLFLRDTRYLSLFEMVIEGRRPLLLGSVLEDDNVSLTVDLTNPDVHRGDDLVMPRDIIAIERTKLLFDQGCYERIGFSNFDSRPRTFRIVIRFDADFRDLFLRLTFTILVSNKDDHLKNHGFLYVGAGRWRLSPVFDVNPAPDRNPHLETAIMEGGAHDRSIQLALDACEFFEITEADARQIIRTTAERIAKEWRGAFRQVGIPGHLARDYEPAFVHEQAEIARSL